MRNLTVKVNHDLIGGLLLIAIGAFAYQQGQQYAMGSLLRMGPGFLPTVLSIILCMMGGILAIASQWKPSSAIHIQFGQVIIVAASLSLFALLLRPLGLFTAAFISVILASWVDRQITWVERLLLASAVATLSSLVFIVGLGMSIPLWWG